MLRPYKGATACGLMRLMVAMALAAPAAPLARAQDVRFDAVSVKPNLSGSGNVGVTTTNSQIRATNVPLQSLIREAYGVQDYQIVGGPDWITVSRWDIVARGAGLDDEPARMRRRQLLADRFGLAVRRESRELPVYALVVARPGVLGAQLKPTAVRDCNPDKQYCGTSINNRTVRAVAVPMSSLATTLSAYVGRTVIDRTGLAGDYDAAFTWTSDVHRPSTGADDGPSIFTAVQEQLGLKLESQRGPVEVLVIDRVERPTED